MEGADGARLHGGTAAGTQHLINMFTPGAVHTVVRLALPGEHEGKI